MLVGRVSVTVVRSAVPIGGSVIGVLAATVSVSGVIEKERFLKDMEESFRHKFANKPNVIEGNMKALRMGMDVQVSLDLLPEISREELISTLSRLRKLRPDDTLKELLTGILPPGLITLIASDNDLYRAAALETYRKYHED